MTAQLTPCTCKWVTKRDPRTFLSSTKVYVHVGCPQHGTPGPKAKP